VDRFVDELTDAEKLRLEIKKDLAQQLHTQLREAVTSVGRSQSVGVALIAAVFAAAFGRGAYGVLLVIPLAWVFSLHIRRSCTAM
jgi:predicted PP-loop superfamily ATPase